MFNQTLLASWVVSHSDFISKPYVKQIGNTTRLELPWKNGKSCTEGIKNKMNRELEKKLLEDFPALFFEDDEKTMESLSFGIECGDGWESILRAMCEVLTDKPSTFLERREPFYGAYKLDVFLHNISRKIERVFNIPTYTLYSQKLNRRYAAFSGFKTKLVKIKEKFGTLRVYYEIRYSGDESNARQFTKASIDAEYNRYSGYVSGAVAYAEALSEKTCENDGAPGQIYSKGWWKTLCPECASKAGKV